MACPAGDFVPALGQFLGSSAGLSATVITGLIEAWQAEQRALAARDMSQVNYVYLRAEGIPREHPPGRAQAVLASSGR
jgi:putative transposase